MEQKQVKSIGTHNGNFHADEVLGCALLINYTQEFKNGKIVRTRDQELLDKQDIVVDVGGIFDIERKRFDHHQHTFSDTFDEKHNTRLSGAGLVYKYYGREIVQNCIIDVLKNADITVEINPNDKDIVELVYQKVYNNFIESVDGIDNGVNQYETKETPKYKVKSTYADRISRMNPTWVQKVQDYDKNFEISMDIAKEEFDWQVKSVILHWYPARPFVLQAVQNRQQVHESGKILKLERYVPWQSHLEDIEEEQNLGDQIKFVIFPENGNKAWRVQAINLKNSFDLRVGLKKEWRGIKDMVELKKISQIEDIVFVHAAGFIGGSKSYESTLRMAIESLQAEQ